MREAQDGRQTFYPASLDHDVCRLAGCRMGSRDRRAKHSGGKRWRVVDTVTDEERLPVSDQSTFRIERTR